MIKKPLDSRGFLLPDFLWFMKTKVKEYKEV